MRPKFPLAGDHRFTIDLTEVGLSEVPLVGVHDLPTAAPGLHQHTHEGLMEICYLKRGERIYRVKGHDYAFRGNEVFVTFPDEPHGSGQHPHGKGVLYWMQVRLPRPSQAFLCLAAGETAPVVKALKGLPRRCFTGSPQLATLFEEIYGRYRERAHPLRKLMIAQSVLRWLLTVIRCARTPVSRNLTDDILAALRMLDRGADQDIKVPALATASGLSTSRFKAKFKAQVGIPPREFLLRRKVERAREMLVEGSHSITDVAYALGFSSSQYFATVFKRFTHMNPRDVRIR